MPDRSTAVLRLRSVTRSFGAMRAVDDVSLEIAAGEILGLVGENGAGKTTLVRLISGELTADAGEVLLEGDAELVHQHFALVDDFTVAENILLTQTEGFRFRTARTVRIEAHALIERAGIAIPDIDRRVEELSIGERAKLELIKALIRNPTLLILDEPTSVLTPIETEELFSTIRELAGRGTAVIFVSHKLPEVLDLAERIVVMRSGRIVADVDAARSDPQSLALAMMGAASRPSFSAATAAEPRETRLAVERLRASRLANVTFQVQSGETVAIVGVAGNGQDQLARILRGLEQPSSGAVSLDRGSAAFIPEDRTRDGIVAEMSIAENLSLGRPTRYPRQDEKRAASIIESFAIKASSARQRAGSLSGGNQQKVLLARELGRNPKVIIAA
ncbi:MAG TPA: ATP-binding cassette domain-containing protein, partial [Thermoanaerobaculia bacterium]|nr:ATP-binding cassette domain-containing protein [Thermoanaerobaculia bacterium]